MWRYFMAPFWVRLLCSTVVICGVGALMVGLLYLRNPAIWREHIVPHRPWVTAGLIVIGVVVGTAVTLATRRSSAELAATLQGLTTKQRSAAYTASHRGPAPEDPAVRSAALRLCEVLSPPEGRAAWIFVGILTLAALAQVPGFAVAVASSEWRQALVPGIILATTGLAAAFHSLNIRRYQRQHDVLMRAQYEAGMNVV